MDSIIEVDGLVKRYGQRDVLKGISFNVQRGRLIGFLGPNGAGKTTTIRILLGLLRASGGSARIKGGDCYRQGPELRRHVGYLPGDVHLYSHMTGGALLRFLAQVRGQNCRQEINRLASVFDLPLNRRVRKYSTGMKQKLGLIQALMHRPEVLILDEPTSTLDPLVRKTVFSELRGTVADGRSVLFSSHSLDEVEDLCDEVIIVREGQLVEHQRIEVLKGRALRRIGIEFESDSIPSTCPESLQLTQQNGPSWKGTWAGEPRELLSWLGEWSVKDLTIERPDLNDLFLRYYQLDGNRDSM